jgi:hypothetical protein
MLYGCAAPAQFKLRSLPSRVIPPNFRRDAVQVGENEPLVHPDQIELIADARDFCGGNDEPGKRVCQFMIRQELGE